MSSKRAASFFQQGYFDFKKGREFRWAEWVNHPFINEYRAGWEKAKQEMLSSLSAETLREVKKLTAKPWWKRWLNAAGYRW